MTTDEILQGLFDNTLVGNAPAVKERNIAPALAQPSFRLYRLDLRHDPRARAGDCYSTTSW